MSICDLGFDQADSLTAPRDGAAAAEPESEVLQSESLRFGRYGIYRLALERTHAGRLIADATSVSPLL